MHLTELLSKEVAKIIFQLYNIATVEKDIVFNTTPKDFVGDFTLVVFPLVKYSKKDPTATAQLIGEEMASKLDLIEDFNIVKGFLNLKIKETYWKDFLLQNFEKAPTIVAPSTEKILIEYSSPNTNKPLHLGHIRNNVLGYAVSGLLKAAGYEVNTCNLINDRGIHICKSMIAWQKVGNGETPESTNMKGDHLVGKYYVIFEQLLQQEREPLLQKLLSDDINDIDDNLIASTAALIKKYKATNDILIHKEIISALKPIVANYTKIMQEAQEMLRLWERGDNKVMDLWKTMNNWVYDGFDITYKNLGVSFDKYYYESETYLLGKELVKEGLEKAYFFKKEDNSVWIDLNSIGLDQKLLLRADGTSVYITQDMGTAVQKYKDFGMDKSIYVVGNEQDYHFKVLKGIAQKMQMPFAEGIYHLSYGMVDLPSGKMKSREGTVVDADDLILSMITEAQTQTEQLGKTDGFDALELQNLYHTIGIGALKFYLLRVDPKKRILFDPKESIDMHGYTGPFVQYTYARIRSILRRFEIENKAIKIETDLEISSVEYELIKKCYAYSVTIIEAAQELNPAKVIDYTYDLAKLYNKFYAECSIFQALEEQKLFRIALSMATGNIIKQCFNMLGIDVPEKM
jgi:arginyl-tRNA synthetase